MRTIYKYPFEFADAVQLELPEEARVIRVACQGDTPCLWALVDTDRAVERRTFLLFGTGHSIPGHVIGSDYVATFDYGPFVRHVFEVRS